MKIQDKIALSDGGSIPRLGKTARECDLKTDRDPGFGLYLSADCERDALEAIHAGYRHLDSAQYYENERQAGESVRKSGIKRSEIFVTSKTFGAPTVEDCITSIQDSITSVDLDYIDLFLIHAPTGGIKHRRTVWKALETLHQQGKIKHLGVSNFGVRHLEEIKSYAKVMPVVNQIELHPWGQHRDIVAKCKELNIVVEAFCPLVRMEKAKDPTLVSVARKHNKDTAQVLIRWSLQKGYVPLPKSSTKERIIRNADVYDFELDHEDMQRLDNLEDDYHTAPNNVNTA